MIQPGQFIVGHLECTKEVRKLLMPWRIIFVHRNFRDACVSFLRQENHLRNPELLDDWDLPEGPEKMLAFLKGKGGKAFQGMWGNMVDWIDEPQVLKLSFEILLGDEGERMQFQAIEAVHAFLNVPEPLTNVQDLARKMLSAPNNTRTGQRSQRAMYWNEKVEEQFEALGGPAIMAKLGYQ